MRIIKAKKNYIILSILVLLLAVFMNNIFSLGNVFFSQKEVLVDKITPMVSIGGEDGWNYGIWEISAILSSDSNGYVVSDDGLEINATYSSDDLEENKVTLTAWGQLENDTLNVDLNSGDVLIAFPLYLFYTYEPSYTSQLDETNNQLNFYSENGEQVGYVKLPSTITYCDLVDGDDCASLESKFLWMYNEYELIIYNNEVISSGYQNNYNFNFDIDYSFSPKEIYVDNSNIVYPYMIFAYDGFGSFETLKTTLKSEANIELNLDNITSLPEEIYDSWQSKWGTETTKYDFYVEYALNGTIDYNSSFNLAYNYNYNDGSIVSYLCGDNNYVSDINDEVCKSEYFGASTINHGIVVGYNLDGVTSKDVDMSIDVIASGTTEISKNLTWNVTYSDDNEVNYPVGISTTFNHRLISDEAGVGAINKLEDNKSVQFDWLIESGTHDLNVTNQGIVKAFNMWNLTDLGVNSYTISLTSEDGIIDTSYNTSTNPVSLDNNYLIKSFYIQDDVEYNYVLNNNSYVLEKVSDVSLYTQKEVYIRIANGDYELIGTYVKDENNNIVYTANDTRTASNTNVSSINPVVLPDNVTDIKISYTGKRAAIYMGINIKTELLSNADTQDTIEQLKGQDIVLKNKATLKYNDSSDELLTGTYLTELNSETYYNTTSKVNSGDSVSYSSYVYEQINFALGSSELAQSIIREQKDANIYILLSKGATLDGDVSITKYGLDENVEFTITQEENYNNSLRTLLKINISNISNNYYVNGNSIQSGYLINYSVLYSTNSNITYGNLLYNDIAYESGTLLSNGYINAIDALDTMFSDSDTKDIYSKLLTSKDNNKVFMTNMSTVDKIVLSSGSYNKNVKNELENDYNASTDIVEGSNYSYRLKYTFNSEYEEISNVIFADKIENSFSSNEYFKGILKDVDISYLASLGVNPTIYYSFDSDINIDEIDLLDEGWTTIKPGNMANVTAIAVDCGSYTFKGLENKVLYVDINMTASNSYVENIKAYNSSIIHYNNVNSGSYKKLNSEITEVLLNEATVNMIVNANIGNGTIEDPAIIQDGLEYEIKLENTSLEYDYDNLEIDIDLPLGFVISTVDETSNLEEYTTGNYVINDNNVLVYRVTKLKENEVKTIKIKLDVSLDNIDFENNLVSNIRLVKLNNLDYNGEEIKLYSKLQVPSLEFNKYVNTNDTTDFTDISSVLVQKGEIYQYRVNVSNVSSIKASNIIVVDNIPTGLIVIEDSISNNGIYNSENGTITWNLDTLEARDIVNLEYSVQVPNDISLGTTYRSSAHISVINPIDGDLLLYDDDTNIISTIYQIVSNIKVQNNLEGNLADSQKLFNYVISVAGDSSNVGTYDIVDSKNEVIGTLVIDSLGSGVSNISLAGNSYFTIKRLPGGIDYTIKQEIASGYDVNVNVDNVIKDGYIVLNSKTDETSEVDYTFNNIYDVETSVDLKAKIVYDKDIFDKTFKLELSNNEGYLDVQNINDNGEINFESIIYDNVEGQYVYQIKQLNLGEKKISYDSSVYKVVVNVINDGAGNLNTDVKYFDKLDNEITEVVFNNYYVPNGLIIGNYNSSEYVDTKQEYNYELILTGIDGTYEVVDMENNKVTTITSNDESVIEYKFVLKNDEKIKVLDLPSNINYVVKQEVKDYYTVTISDLDYDYDEVNKVVSYSSVTPDDMMQIIFNNNYVTKAEILPEVSVVLENKELENGEFQFKITDISEGSTSGYSEVVTNDSEGNVNFNSIAYNKPGKYVYEITQIKGNSNYIYYDLSKCLLTITLEDNGDGTMNIVEKDYQYLNDNVSFVNRYSSVPIDSVDNIENDNKNPNTRDRVWIIAILFTIVIILFIIEGRIKLRKYEMKI